MALRNILQDGDPTLAKQSRMVTDFNERLHVLLDDMRETLINASGLGLAAPQVGVLRRVALIVDVQEEPADDDEHDVNNAGDTQEEPEQQPESTMIELINPEIVTCSGEQSGSEGCLSLPGQYGIVKRPQTVKIKAQNRDGEYFDFEGSGMTARAICHEIDHLNGIIFTAKAERMLSEEELEEMRKA